MILHRLEKRRHEKSKPRASGDDPLMIMERSSSLRVNPARAGMILVALVVGRVNPGKPRASGDDPKTYDLTHLIP